VVGGGDVYDNTVVMLSVVEEDVVERNVDTYAEVGCSARVLGEQDVEVGGSSVDGVRDVGERDVEVSVSIVDGV
jgi:hypothetical protein